MKKQLTLYAYAMAIFVLAVIGRVLIDFVCQSDYPTSRFSRLSFLLLIVLTGCRRGEP
jgi:hypothetical protein